MIRVNEKLMDWQEGLSFDLLLRRLGYTIKNPPILVRVNGQLVKKTEREDFVIPDGAVIEIKTILRGG
jgi:thiamine biosynthesis protein ThiS